MILDINLLKSIPFFESFPEELLNLVLPHCELKNIPPKQIVLQQGDINLDLFFLIDGTVSVFVDNKSVVSVTGDGEIFGEMSLASHSACTATVATKTGCTFIQFNFNEINNLHYSQKDSLLKYCWQSIAGNLSNKLIATNEIAKTYRQKYKESQEPN